MSEKAVFRFRMPDGSIGQLSDLQKYQSDLTNDFIEQRRQEFEAFVTSEMYQERLWRNQELILTDKLMFSDSTYNGKLVAGSEYQAGILEYRQQLHDYDLKYQPRPQRPAWFKG